jgi:Uma2 family endonuclease
MSKVIDNPAPASYEDLLRVPEHLVAEIVDGELFSSPRPASRHARASTLLGAQITRRFDEGDGGPGGWWIVDEPELHLGRDVLVPDIAGWRRERMPVFPDVAWFDVAPDWICEVVSPSTTLLDRVRKLPRYARYGIPYAWVVDPKAHSVEVYLLKGELYSLFSTHEGADVIRAEPFDACEINLASLWIDPEVDATLQSPQS